MLNDQAERLQKILLCGDREAAAALAKACSPEILLRKNHVLRSLTDQYREGSVPFCQLTAACEAAAMFYDASLPPVACCGAVRGNTCPTGRDFMMMLLRGWGVPAVDLGTDTAPETFVAAIRRHQLRFVICTAFSQDDLATVRQLHELAKAEGLRDSFSLLLSGINPEPSHGVLPLDYQEHSAAQVAEWVVNAWNS